MSDPVARSLLGVIALLLALGLVQDLGRPGAGDERRFQVVAIRAPGGPVLIRTDTATGEVWKREMREEDAGWIRLQEEASAAAPEAETADSEAAGGPLTPEQVDSYLGLLEDPDPGVRAYGAKRLGAAPPERALEPLSGLLEDPDPSVVIAAIASLRRLGDPSAVEKLRGLVKNPDPGVKRAAAGAVRALQ